MGNNDWSSYFADSFTKASDRAAQIAYEREKAKSAATQQAFENAATTEKLKLDYAKLGYTPTSLTDIDPIKARKYGMIDTGLGRMSKNPNGGRAAWVFDPMTGEFTPSPASIGKGDVVRNIRRDPVEQKASMNLNDYISSASDVANALDKIEDYGSKLPDFKTGVYNQTKARIGTGLGEYSADPVFTEYSGVLNTELIPLARKLQEEKGPITASDVEKVEKGLGQKHIPLAQRKKILGESRQKVRNAIETKLKLAGKNIDWLKTNQPELHKKLYTQKFTVGGKNYFIPNEEVEDFKKAKGIK